MTKKDSASSIHQVENELKDSAENFRLIFDQIPYILEIFTPDGMTVMVNRQWEETYKTDKSQVIGKFNLLEDQQIKDLGILPLLRKAFEGETVIMPDSEFDPAKSQYPGRKRWLRTKVIPIKDDGGEVQFVAIMHEDITERKNAEDALRESEEKYRNIFNSVLDVYFETDVEGKILELSPAIERITGYKREDLISKSSLDLYVDAENRDSFISKIASESVVNDYEMALVHKNGQVITVSISAELEKDPAGAPLKIRGTMRDITERMEMEKALRQAHDELEARVEQRTAELEKANQQLATLYEMAQAITAPLQLKVVLDEIAQNTAKLFGTDTGVILLLDEDEQVLTIQGAYGLSEKVIKETRDRLGESIAGRVAQTGEPIIANDLPNDPRFHNPSCANEGLLAGASVPLIVRGKIIGTLDIHSKTNRFAFNQDHIRMLNKLAGQAATAIENARLYEQLQLARDELEVRVRQRTTELVSANAQLRQEISERKHTEEELRQNRETALQFSEQLAILQEVTNQLSQAESSDELCKLAVELVRSRLGFDRAAIHFLGENPDIIIGMFGTDENGNLRDERGYRVELGPKQLAWHILSSKESITIVENSPLYNHLGQEVGEGELAAATLWDGDKTIGVVSVDNLIKRQSFTEQQLEILRLYATTLGHLIKRKQVEDELRQHHDHLEDLVAERTIELAAINQELEAFSYSVSHDLRAPLRHINGYLDVLQECIADTLDTESQQYMAKISAAALKMNLLIEGLLALSRLGRQQLSKRQVELDALAQEVIQEHIPETKDREIHWQIADLPNVFGDPTMLRIVLSNLISNALKYTRPRQPAIIEIGARPSSQGEDIVFIRDNGVGFDMAYADRLFGVFQRLHGADEFEGTGIGLATVQRIIQRHGGRIWAEAEVDQGANFYFTLPREVSP